MTREEFKQTLEDKLKECDKDTLVNIIADLCLVYVGARAMVDMSSVNCMQQHFINIQTDIQAQEADNFIQKVNANLYETRK